MKCENIRLLLTSYLTGEHDPALKKTVDEHLETCCDCRASLQKIRSTLDLVQGALAATQKAPSRLAPDRRLRVLSTRPAAPVSWLTRHRPMVSRIAAVLVAGVVVISLVSWQLDKVTRESLEQFGGAPPSTARLLWETICGRGNMFKLSDMVGGASAPASASFYEPKPVVGDEMSVSGTPAGWQHGEPLLDQQSSSVSQPATIEGRSYATTPETAAGRKRAGSRSSPLQEILPQGDKGEVREEPLARAESIDNLEMPADPAASPGFGGGTAGFGIGSGSGDEEPGFEMSPVKSPLVMHGLYASRRAGGSVTTGRPEAGRDSDVGMGDDIDEKTETHDDETVAAATIAPAPANEVNVTGIMTDESERSDKYQERSWGLDAGGSSVPAKAKPKAAAPTRLTARTEAPEKSMSELATQIEDGREPGAAVAPKPVEPDARILGGKEEDNSRVDSVAAVGYNSPINRDGVPVLGAIPALGRLFREDRAVSTTEDAEGGERRHTAALAGVSTHSKELREGKKAPSDWISGELDQVVTLSGKDITYEEDADSRSSPLQAQDASAANGGRSYSTPAEKAAGETKSGSRTSDKRGWPGNTKIPYRPINASGRVPTSEPEPAGPVFKAVGMNPFVITRTNQFSTFGMDVDTASYTLARNYMLKGFLPPAESVRTEEFVNFFDYTYKPPTDKLFAIYADCAPTPFARGLHLLKIGVEGKRLARDAKKRAVLTCVIDTSGSMSEPDRLPLIRRSLNLLIDQLDPADSIAIVQYDSHARLVLDQTPIAQKKAILAALDSLQTSGSTNLEEGMREGYKLAARRFVPGAVNRVLLLSDGAANLGSVEASQILTAVESFRKQGVYCSVFGFGIGTYNDEILKALASKGDGTYAFIDSMEEAKRVFVEKLTGTLNVIAADAKIQVEFNPDRVKRHRQLGYEERQLRKEQFRDDTVDAGEVGAGQSVTALYELELDGPRDGKIGTVRVRYKNTGTGKVEEFERAITQADICHTFEATDSRFKLAAGVAEFAEILRGSDYAGGIRYSDVAAVLRPVALELNLDFRLQELVRMVQGASSMPRAPAK
ncbi:MAG: von Willebrand factor type A domain-containing protein [bacterium]